MILPCSEMHTSLGIYIHNCFQLEPFMYRCTGLYKADGKFCVGYLFPTW